MAKQVLLALQALTARQAFRVPLVPQAKQVLLAQPVSQVRLASKGTLVLKVKLDSVSKAKLVS
jgi:hypothetical protein